MKRTIITLIIAAAATFAATAQTKTPIDGYPRFALGADVSWTPYIEQNGTHQYFTADGAATTVTDMVSDFGIDAIRLRVWVDPKSDMAMSTFKFKVSGATWEQMSTYGTCSVDEMVALARRFARRGQRLMVSFQFSDSWADPARQFIPASWADCKSVDQLSERAVAHVRQVLVALHDRNVNVAWVQIGNETNTGMMKWNMPTASGQTVQTVAHGCEIGQRAAGVPSETTYNFVRVFGDVARAAKAIYPDTKTVLHLTKTSQWTTLNWTLNLLKQAGFGRDICDYVGLSLYPGVDDGREDYTADWQRYADLGLTTISNIYRTYGFRTILCEIGLNNEWSESTTATTQAANIAQCNQDVRAYTQYLIDKLSTDESTCDGLFYWEPETDYMKGYKKGACVALNPSSSWSRTNVTANDWWYTVKENSTFPLGGLKDYIISDKPEPEDNHEATFRSLYLYYYDTDNHYLPMTTTNGITYTLTGFEAPRWFKFRIVTMDWAFATGGVEVGLDTNVTLNSDNGWDAWTNVAVPATATWTYNAQTNQLCISTDGNHIAPPTIPREALAPGKNYQLSTPHDLQGRPTPLTRQAGIYIVNRRKIVVR